MTNKLPLIASICETCDVLLLQETWIMPYSTSLLDNVHPDFSSFSVSSVSLERELIGRPYGGLSVMGRRNIGGMCRVELYDDVRLLGLEVLSYKCVSPV